MFRSQISNLIPLFLTGLLSAQVPGEAKKAKDARVILDAWHQESPRAEERTLHFVLWTPNNREPPHQHEARLGRIMEHLQNFYGKEMDRLGFGPRSINLPRDPDGQVKIHLIKGDHPTAHYQKSSGSDIRKECLPVLRKAGITAAQGKSIQVSGTLSADPPAYAVVAYFDPEGGGDYNSATATAVPDANGKFSLSCDALPPGKSGELRLIPLHVNGSTGGWMSQTKFRYPYSVAKDGTPELSTFQIKNALAPLIEALNKRDRTRAQGLTREVEGSAGLIANNLLTRGGNPTKTPAQIDGVILKKIPLTNFKPTTAKVGWGRPAYNFLPDPSLLLEAGGKIFTTGIYAHAPASHTYDLGKKFTSLTGSSGVAAGKRGSVQFEIKGDGKTLWRSKTLKAGNLAPYKVDLKGVNKIELLTHPTNDGSASDWALWLAPTLESK